MLGERVSKELSLPLNEPNKWQGPYVRVSDGEVMIVRLDALCIEDQKKIVAKANKVYEEVMK